MVKLDYEEVNKEIINKLENICGDEFVITEKTQMEDYKEDETPDTEIGCEYPDVLVKPKSAEEVSEIMKLADEKHIPVTPIGGRTGLSGGSVPVYGGIGLSIERINEKIEVDEDNLMVEVDAGVRMENLYEAVEEKNLALPIHPTTEDSQIGGSIATNAGGEVSMKHGVMRDYVKGLEVVLPNGKIIKLGGKLLKNNSGYSLLNLIIGSEGTLGIITRATLRLYPPSEKPRMVIIPFESRENAIKTVPEIVKSGIIPDGIEYIDGTSIMAGELYTGDEWPIEKGKATLIVLLSGRHEEEILEKGQEIVEICEKRNAIDTFLAMKDKEIDKIWGIRLGIPEAGLSGTIEGYEPRWSSDMVVPPSKIPKFLERTEEILNEYSLDTLFGAFGHAGDGNVHVSALFKEDVDEKKVEEIREKWMEEAVKMGGSITGEHGIGIAKKEALRKYTDTEVLKLMEGIKELFDPNYILNPGKIVPETEEIEEKYCKL